MADRKVDTIDLKGKKYATVAERIKQFRADYPNSKILSRERTLETGETVFKAYIWRNREDYISGDLDSADSDGMAKSKISDKAVEKDFEKLQTIAIGRALAILGYLASGEIASFEEMEEFEAHKKQVRETAVRDTIDAMENAKTLDELKEIFVSSNLMQDVAVLAAKDKRKAELVLPGRSPAHTAAAVRGNKAREEKNANN